MKKSEPNKTKRPRRMHPTGQYDPILVSPLQPSPPAGTDQTFTLTIQQALGAHPMGYALLAGNGVTNCTPLTPAAPGSTGNNTWTGKVHVPFAGVYAVTFLCSYGATANPKQFDAMGYAIVTAT